LLAATSATPNRITISSASRVAGPVSFFDEVATFQGELSAGLAGAGFATDDERASPGTN
jgi:hypothetical protein